MAFQQFIKGSFNGRVGSVVGQKWKNKTQLHARVFSKSPPTEKQTKNVRAFECLNRLSSAMAKTWFPWLGLSAKEMYPHNAVSRWLKPLIASHQFEPEVIRQLIEEDGQAVLEEFQFNRATGQFNCIASTTINPAPGSNESWLVTVLDSTGKVYICESPRAKKVTIERIIQIPYYVSLCAFTMVSKKVDKKYQLSGLYYDELPPQYECHLVVESVILDDTLSRVTVTGYSEEEIIEFEGSLPVSGRGVAGLQNLDFTVDSSFKMNGDGTFTQVFNIPKDAYGDRYYFRKGNLNTVPKTEFTKGKASIVVYPYSFNVRDGNKTFTYKKVLPSFARSGTTFALSNSGWFADGFVDACNVQYDEIIANGSVKTNSAEMTCELGAQGVNIKFTVSSNCRGNRSFKTNDDAMMKLYVEGEDGNAVWDMETLSERFSFSYWDNPINFNLTTSTMSTSSVTATSGRRWFADTYKGRMYWKSIPTVACSFMKDYWSSTGYSMGKNIVYDATARGLCVVSGGQSRPAHSALSRIEFTANSSTSYVNAVASNGVTVRLRYAVGSSKVTWTRAGS